MFLSSSDSINNTLDNPWFILALFIPWSLNVLLFQIPFIYFCLYNKIILDNTKNIYNYSFTFSVCFVTSRAENIINSLSLTCSTQQGKTTIPIERETKEKKNRKRKLLGRIEWFLGGCPRDPCIIYIVINKLVMGSSWLCPSFSSFH